MATFEVELLAVRRPAIGAVRPAVIRKPARMTITPEPAGSTPILIPLAPREVEHSDLGGEYVTIDRPGLPDAMAFSNELVPKMSFTLTLIDRPATNSQRAVSVVGIIAALRSVAQKGIRVRISYGQLESGLWYIDSIGTTVQQRDPVTDEVSQASLSLSLTRASEVQDGVGPITGGVKPPAPPPAPPQPQKKSARYYTVKKGDTFWAISVRFYGTGTKWRTIADANKITNPKTLRVGKVLRIP